MNWKDIENEYVDLLEADPERYLEDYRRVLPDVKNSKALFRDEVVPYSYKPLFYTEEDIENFKKIGRTMLEIGDKVVDEYLVNPDFRRKFGFPKELEGLIILENGYGINVPMARLDIFYKDGENFKFCELNTDGSSAMLEDNSFAEITLNTQAIKDMEGKYDFYYFELIDSWVDESLRIYETWESEDKEEKPNIAIMDFRESATSMEFQEFKKAYQARGLKAEIVDPRDLDYRDGKLYDGDYRIDMIYRRLVTSEMMDQFESVGEFTKAYKDGAVCVIGSLRSQLIHNKIIFKVLHDKDTLELFNDEEKEFVKRHIPFTGEFSGDRDVFEEVRLNKNKYIMKPSDMNVAKGVFVGRDLKQEDWESRLEDAWDRDYIYQEFVDGEFRDFFLFEDGEMEKVSFNSVIGLFMYGGEFAGLYTRIGPDNVISSVTGYRAANIVSRKK